MTITEMLVFLGIIVLISAGYLFLAWIEDRTKQKRCEEQEKHPYDYRAEEARKRKLTIMTLCNSVKNLQNSFKLWLLLNSDIPLCYFDSWDKVSGSYKIQKLDCLWREYKDFYYKTKDMREFK